MLIYGKPSLLRLSWTIIICNYWRRSTAEALRRLMYHCDNLNHPRRFSYQINDSYLRNSWVCWRLLLAKAHRVTKGGAWVDSLIYTYKLWLHEHALTNLKFQLNFHSRHFYSVFAATVALWEMRQNHIRRQWDWNWGPRALRAFTLSICVWSLTINTSY